MTTKKALLMELAANIYDAITEIIEYDSNIEVTFKYDEFGIVDDVKVVVVDRHELNLNEAENVQD